MNLNPTTLQLIGAALFLIALIHTFSTKVFERLAHAQPAHAGLWHLLGEVEIVFGVWAMVLTLLTFAIAGSDVAIGYLETRNFTEPMFVFAIMVVAGTRPILGFARGAIAGIARVLPVDTTTAIFWLTLALVPLLGSFITEPAAMTLAALMLRERFFVPAASERFKYATLGVLFVNISIGGTLTNFAAPPVLMVASAWGWDSAYMFLHFGDRAALAVAVNATALTLLFRRELAGLVPGQGGASDASAEAVAPVPLTVVVVHLLFLAGVVVFAHHPVVFMGLFLFFMGYTTAYARYQDALILREGLLVAFFLAGLVVLGGQQQWWLQPVLTSLSADQVYYGATALTAITDNAALTYLGSLVEGLSEQFKLALVAGAVTGGGLTIIANAPNPAGVSILRERFEHQTVQPLGLLAAAALPTLVAICAFRFL